MAKATIKVKFHSNKVTKAYLFIRKRKKGSPAHGHKPPTQLGDPIKMEKKDTEFVAEDVKLPGKGDDEKYLFRMMGLNDKNHTIAVVDAPGRKYP
jgi:hypothetical protein